MDRRILILGTITVLTVICASIYVNYVLLDNITDFEIYIKWIPAFLFAMQSGLYILNHQIKRNKLQANFCLFLFFGFIMCMIGDLFLIFKMEVMYIFGMAFFMMSYLFFGTSRITSINNTFVCINHKIKISIGIVIIFSCLIAFLVYIIDLSLNSQTFNSIPMIVAICIYSLFIGYSVTANYIYLVINVSRSALLSFVGVVLFALSDGIIILHDVQYTNVYVESIGMIVYWTGLNILSWSVHTTQEYLPLNGEI